MKTRRTLSVMLAATMVLALLGSAPLEAHDVLYPGTVLRVEPERLQVKTVDPDTKKDVNLWFTITKDTKVKRGDTLVPYANAKIVKDERIVAVVNHDAEGRNVATELRLAVR